MIGGVERVIAQQVRAFVAHGIAVTVCAGTGGPLPGADWVPCEELVPDDPLVKAATEETRGGCAGGSAHARLAQRFLDGLKTTFADCELVLVHNLFTMPFNIAATEALWRWAETGERPRLVHWLHDIAVINPNYTLGACDSPPWSLLRRNAPGVQQITVSETRRRQWIEVSGAEASEIGLCPNPLDASEIAGLSPVWAAFAETHRIWERDLVLLHPTRVLRRKNIECTIRTVAALRAAGCDAVALITGAPDPFNPASAEYGEDLREIIAAAGMQEAVWFLRDQATVADSDLAGLYQMADLLFFPSRQEGFGLPVVEAALLRVPVAMAEIEPLRELASSENALFFPLETAAETVAVKLKEWMENLPAHVWRKRTLRRHLLARIWHEHLLPLLQ